MQPTESQTILSLELGNKPGMRKKIIILWNAPKNIIKANNESFAILREKYKRYKGRRLSTSVVYLQDTHCEDTWVRNPGKREKGSEGLLSNEIQAITQVFGCF